MRKIVITSGKGGVGKSVVAVNLGLALNHYGRQVILVDGSFAFPHIGLMLGKSNFEETILSAIEGKKSMKDIVYKHQTGLRIIPGNISLEHLHKKDIKKFTTLIDDLKEYCEVALIDTTSGVHIDTLETIRIADDIILVTTPDFVSVTETLRMLKVIRQNLNVSHILGIIVTQHMHKEHDMTIENIQMLTDEKVIGVIPYHVHVKESLKLKHPVLYSHPSSSVSESFERVACNLIGKTYVEKEVTKTKTEEVMEKLGLKKWYETIMKEADN
ncbi:MAG: MinD/ParA family ATP-binding protein [Candidatus Woesearchaeota archaeon]